MKKGFTLIELLVVVLIIGILSAVALPQYTKSVQKARFAELTTLGKSLSDAQNMYYLANDRYTSDIENLDVEVPEGKYFSFETTANGDGAEIVFTPKTGIQNVTEIVYYFSDGKLNQIICSGSGCRGMLPCQTYDVGSATGCSFNN